MNILKLSIGAIAFTAIGQLSAEEYKLFSPDKNILVEINTDKQLSYNIFSKTGC